MMQTTTSCGREFDAECGAQTGTQRPRPAPVLLKGLARVEKLNHLGHLGGDLIDTDRLVWECVVQRAEHVGYRHEICCLRG